MIGLRMLIQTEASKSTEGTQANIHPKNGIENAITPKRGSVCNYTKEKSLTESEMAALPQMLTVVLLHHLFSHSAITWLGSK